MLLNILYHIYLVMATYEMIRCLKCNIEKDEDDFYRSTYKEWKKNCCKDCWREYTSWVTTMERLATINYQQERAKKYFREKRRRE